jgi:uncharacterized protein
MIFLECFIKIHKRPPDTVVIGVCDKEVLGQTLRSGEYCYKVSEAFFKDQLVSLEKAVEILTKSTNFNAVGPKIITALLEKKLIHPEGILTIENVPIALRFVF